MTSRLPVSLVILAWNAWEETEACLSSLFPTLDVDDEVIVVDNGSSDETPERLAEHPWVRVLRNEENRGFAVGCNQGAALATRGILVFLNNDTVLAGGWIESLIEPFSDERVVASGPRSNFVSGPQLVLEPGYVSGDHEGLSRFVATWQATHGGAISVVDRLVGFCLAVRADRFRELGGFDEGYEIGGYEDDDLCRRLAESGGSLVIAHGSYVHHRGHRTFDANDVDWVAQELHNRERFLAKFKPPAATPASSGSLALEMSLAPPAPVSPEDLLLREAAALLASGEVARAGDLVLSVASRPGAVDQQLPSIVALLRQAGRPLEQLVRLIHREHLRPFLGHVLALDSTQADVVLEACASVLPEELAVLAAAATLALHLPVERAIVWSARLRGAGLAEVCPLVSEKASDRSVVDQARAAAAAVRLFGDSRGRARLEAALAAATAEEDAAIARDVAAICPELLGI